MINLGKKDGYDIKIERHTFATHMHHDDIDASDWALVPIIAKGSIASIDGKHYFTHMYAGKRYFLALNKVDKDKTYYVSTLFARRLDF